MERKNTLKLSIIVPVFNVEEYLVRCVDSLLRQDIDKSEYEIIIVNDGSTDGSLEIARRIEQKQENVVLISQENKGLSGARNTGLRHVHGKYVLFVDSDDYFSENAIGRIIEIAESNSLDLCFFRTVFEYNNGCSRLGEKQPFCDGTVYNGEYLVLNGMNISSVWQNLYSVEFLLGTGIQFYEGIVHEDIDFNFRLYPLAKRVMFTDIYAYHYCVYRESILRTKSPDKVKYLIESDFKVVDSIRAAITRSEYSEKIKKLYIKHGNSMVVSNLIKLLQENSFNSMIKNECFDVARQLGVYPIHGRTNSWKTTLLGHLLNCEWLYKALLR